MDTNGHNPTQRGAEEKCPMLRIVFNPPSYQCVTDGSVANLEFARYMLRSALETALHFPFVLAAPNGALTSPVQVIYPFAVGHPVFQRMFHFVATDYLHRGSERACPTAKG